MCDDTLIKKLQCVFIAHVYVVAHVQADIDVCEF